MIQCSNFVAPFENAQSRFIGAEAGFFVLLATTLTAPERATGTFCNRRIGDLENRAIPMKRFWRDIAGQRVGTRLG